MVIRCAFCGKTFEEDRGQPTCQACPLSEGCGFVRCPYCGYENVPPPSWWTKLAALTRRRPRRDDAPAEISDGRTDVEQSRW